MKKFKFHIPTQSFGFLEVEGNEKDLEEMKSLYNLFAETPINFDRKFQEVETFTGEKVLYDPISHKYTDLNGNALMSGSQFAESLQTPFDKEKILPAVAKKLDVEEKAIDAMWTANSNMSKTFGTAVHLAMEQWFKHNGHGTKYHLPKHPFLLKLVKDFPLKDADVYPEIMVSCVERKMVGQIDGLVKTGENPEDKRGYLIDYKTDAEVEKNLPKHFAQLSFYAFILKQFGWEIEKVEVWNYTTKWENHASDVLNLKELQNGKASNN